MRYMNIHDLLTASFIMCSPNCWWHNVLNEMLYLSVSLATYLTICVAIVDCRHTPYANQIGLSLYCRQHYIILWFCIYFFLRVFSRSTMSTSLWYIVTVTVQCGSYCNKDGDDCSSCWCAGRGLVTPSCPHVSPPLCSHCHVHQRQQSTSGGLSADAQAAWMNCVHQSHSMAAVNPQSMPAFTPLPQESSPGSTSVSSEEQTSWYQPAQRYSHQRRRLPCLLECVSIVQRFISPKVRQSDS